MRVSVIGDATLDIMVRPAEQPRAGGDVAAQITLSPGGQGANVAVRLARAGASVTLATAIADDVAGRLLLSALQADGVALARLPAERSGTVVAFLDADGERSMLSDRVTFAPAAVAAACVGAEWIHCSGYPLADDATGDQLAGVIGGLPATARVSVGGGSLPSDAELAARVRDRIARTHARLLILSRDEAEALLNLPLPSLAAAADALASAFPGAVAVVTGGATGSAGAGPGFALSVPARDPATPMVDATGAGDAYAAALILVLGAAEWAPEVAVLRAAMEAGSRAGGLAARVAGAQARIAGEPGAGR